MRCTTVQGIIRALTNAIGSYPPSVGITRKGEHGTYIEAAPDHGVNRLLKRPNKVQTATQYSRMVMQHTALYGNHYSLKGQGQSGPVSFLRPIEDPDAVTLDDVSKRRTSMYGLGAVYKVSGLGLAEPFVPAKRMVHVTSGIVSDNGIMGESPVVLAREAIGICIAAELMIADLYGNNAMPSMVLTGGKWQNEEQYEMWVRKWKEVYGSGGFSRGTALLPDGMEAQEMSFKPVDAQVLEMRKFQRIEIAQVYGIPPHKLADLERATFSNIEEQSLEFVRDTAKPWVRLIEQAQTRDLLTEDDQHRGYVVRYDMEAATEGKLKDRIDAYGKAHEVGAMNPNEIRQRIGLDPRDDEGGEAYATPLNMRTTDDAEDEIETEGTGDESNAGGADASSIRAV
jgi:HK97 family phage portal protein